MYAHIDEVKEKVIAPGVVERVLMDPVNDIRPGFGARHYTLTNGGILSFEENMTEFQHYIISGCVLSYRRLIHQDTAVFMAAGSHGPGQNQRLGLNKHSLTHAGEGESRIITFSHKVPRPAFRWAKSRSRNLFEVPSPHQDYEGYTQPITEEEHAVMGALRFHGVDIQTHPAGEMHGGRIDPDTGEWIGSRHNAECLYFLRGHGESMEEGNIHKVSPGSFLFSRDFRPHGIRNTTDDILQYIVMELIEHDKSWTGRLYQGDISPQEWEQ
jgi:hypothetical protein